MWIAGLALGFILNTAPPETGQNQVRPSMKSHAPINPKATPEAKELLAFLYSSYHKVTLTGQHNQMFHMSDPSESVEKITGKYPLIWGGEWGFSDERHDTDNIKYRPRLLDQIREQHKKGRIICLTWHETSPTIGEPCDFSTGVQAKITEKEYEDILNPGTPLHRVWQQESDKLAQALLELQKEHIPIIFRPYHEMNGDWFWWGGRPDYFKRLWSMIYDRYVNHYHLNNLLWAWNPDKPYAGVENFCPGPDKMDLVGTDIYPAKDRPETYPQEWYDRMHKLAGDKPLALSEMSELPTLKEWDKQPWAWFMFWDNLGLHANKPDMMKAYFDDPRVSSTKHG